MLKVATPRIGLELVGREERDLTTHQSPHNSISWITWEVCSTLISQISMTATVIPAIFSLLSSSSYRPITSTFHKYPLNFHPSLNFTPKLNPRSILLFFIRLFSCIIFNFNMLNLCVFFSLSVSLYIFSD